MKRIVLVAIVALLFGSMFLSCSKRKSKMTKDTDTMSYVVGMNVGMALLKMDSTLNIDVVCAALRDAYKGEAKMTIEEARNYYLAEKTYFVHEKAKAYQEQFLADLSKEDRKYVRTRSGVTYKILKLGDQSRQGSMSSRDTVRILYTMTDESGRVIVDADTLRDSYRNLVKGLQDVIKLAGDGAHFNAWLPSKTAYGVEGNEKLGVGPNTMLNYDVTILDIKYNR
jgi:FKBP-type peptidyl-prolyl cis-trans isomerase FkpA